MKSLKAYISILKSVKNRPTKLFLYLVIVIVTLFLQAYMHNYNIVYLVMFFLVGVAGASSIFGVFNIYNIQVKLLSNDRFFAKRYSTYRLLIVNDSDEASYDINITVNDETKHLNSIGAHKSQTISFGAKFDKRGEVSLSNVRLHSLFPLPHELKYKEIPIDKKLIIYAKPDGISLFNIYNKNDSINGEIDEFEGVKKFNQGENISYIHWASLAKNDTLMSKHFLYEDENKKLHFNFKKIKGDDESKLSQLTLWILECEKYDLDFSIDLNGEIIDSKKRSINEILETIAKY